MYYTKAALSKPMKTLAYVVTTAIVVHLITVNIMTKQTQESTKPEFAATPLLCDFVFNGKLTKEAQAFAISRIKENSSADEWKDFNKHCLTTNLQPEVK